MNFDFKNGRKMNLRAIKKNRAADSKIESPLKSILEPIGLTSPSRQHGSFSGNFTSKDIYVMHIFMRKHNFLLVIFDSKIIMFN